MKGIPVQCIYDWLNALAPFDTAEDFDNVGLLLGDPAAPVENALFGLDLTPALARRAAEIGAELVITHHPIIFSPLRRIDYTIAQGQALCELAGRRVNVLAAHTNWDKAPGGVSDSLAQALCLHGATRGDDYLRIGELTALLTADELEQAVRTALKAPVRRYGTAARSIGRVAVAGGAYGEGAARACALGAQAYVVGEIRHHEVLDACARGLVVYEAGHAATELPGVAALYRRFQKDAAEAAWPVTPHLYTGVPYAGAMLAL